MAPIRIAGAQNPVNQVEFELELPGDELLTFAVPKMQYLAKPIVDRYSEWYEDWQRRANSDDPEQRAELRDTDTTLKMFELVLPKSVYNKIAKLTRGELMALDREWSKASGVAVGEFGASDGS